jgi:xylulokinase
MNLLGIDLGTSSVKVLITNEDGGILSRGSADYPMRTPQPGWVEQAPDEWWQATLLAVGQALSAFKEEPGLGAIGLSGQMHGTVLLDSKDQLLGPAIIWPDQRSSRQVEEITALVGMERLIGITGSIAATGFQAATLRWMQQNKEQVWAKTRRVLLPKDYLRWRLCDQFGTDPSDAAGTGLLDGGGRIWSQELLDDFQIDAHLLPPIKPSITQAGRLCSSAAHEFGLSEGIPVVIGAADTAASLLGVGITKARDLLLTISTGGQLITPSTTFIVHGAGLWHTFCSAVEPKEQAAGWYLMGATLSAGQSLRWLRDNVFKTRSGDAYPQMMAWAEQSAIGAEGLFFTPYLSGERAPAGDSRVRGVFLGLTTRHGRAELVRAVLEGVVYSLYEKYLALVDDGVTPERLILAGGGARSKLWTQIAADMFGLPVEKVLIEEQSAYGAALLAGAGAGLFDVADGAREWRNLAGQIEPDLKAHAQYQELLPVYREIQQRTRSFPGLVGSDKS